MHIAKQVLHKIPHCKPFRFIDGITKINDELIVGNCFLHEDSFYYKGHFPKHPITPGFIITEAMAQIGILGLGLYLARDQVEDVKMALLTSSDVKFHNISYPNDTIVVHAKKIYFRFNKLKCYIESFNQHGDMLCSGTFTGIIRTK